MAGFLRAVGRHGHPRRRAGLAQRGDLPADRPGARARGDVRRRHRLAVRAGQRQAARPADPERGAAARRSATVEMDAARRTATIATYSKGMKQRIKMATALVHDPPVLLLDEPFNGMDPRQRLQLMDLLRAMGDAGRTVLFSSHILEEVEQIAGAHRGDGRRPARRVRRLPRDPPADDRAAAPVHGPLRATTGRWRRRSSPTRSAASRRARPGPAGRSSVQAIDFDRFTTLLPQLAREAGIRLFEVSPVRRVARERLLLPGERR